MQRRGRTSWRRKPTAEEQQENALEEPAPRALRRSAGRTEVSA